MSSSINGKTITMTRGDTFLAQISITDGGTAYTPTSGDSIRFAMKRSYNDTDVKAEIDIPYDTMVLEIPPEATKNLPYGKYVYDIQITFDDGRVDTFIPEGTLVLTKEVE